MTSRAMDMLLPKRVLLNAQKELVSDLIWIEKRLKKPLSRNRELKLLAYIKKHPQLNRKELLILLKAGVI